MASWYGWLLCVCVVQAVRFNDRLLVKKPMKTTGEVLEILSLSKRQNIPGIGQHVPMIRGANGPVATLLNIKESESNARAAVQGVTNYDGDLIIPRETITPVGYPVSVNIDRDPDDFERGDGPLFKLFPKDSSPIRKDTSGKSDELKKEEAKKKKEEEDEKKKEDEEIKKREEEKKKLEVQRKLLEEEKKKLDEEDKKKEAERIVEKVRKEAVEKKKIEAEVRLKLIEEIRKIDDDRKHKEEQKKKNDEEKKRKDEERRKMAEFERRRKEEERRKEDERKKIEEARRQREEDKIKLQNKINGENKNNAGASIPRDKSFICYLPKIVVITRMIGSMVVNEVKVYGDSHNEKSVHKFISTHVVSANASELINEFTLPPQFILGVSPEIEKDNDVSITKTAAYTNAGQLNVPGIIIKKPDQGQRVVYQTRLPPRQQSLAPPAPRPPLNPNYGPRFTTRQPATTTLVPTFNPFLPTTKTSTTTTPTTTPTTTTSTTTTTPTTTTSTTTTTTTTTTTATTTPATTVATTTVKQATTTPKPKAWNIDVISDIVAKKSNVKSKEDARRVLEWLNYVARHRNAASDVPVGDPNTFTGYQMVPPNYSI